MNYFGFSCNKDGIGSRLCANQEKKSDVVVNPIVV